jgi:hypothetical protein
MSDALALMFAIKAVSKLGRNDEAQIIPEPEFAPFVFRPVATAPVKKETSRAKAIVSANTARASRTLAELGVPNPLASEMELCLGLMGYTDGGNVVGYTFVTPDGASHALRLSEAKKVARATNRAA